MPERKLDEFRIEDPLGVGTVGTIYRATDLRHDRAVALKILLPAVSKEPLIQARFEREMVILEKLSHPNIVRYFGGGRSDGQLFYAMELLTGGSLKDELSGHGPLSFLESVTCGVQICSALQHAHNHGIIHRDLKPSNLLFDENGHLKLVDFGIARDTHGADITSDGLTVGSYAYMPPEQITGEKSITGHVDLYAFGCLMFEMLAGRPPFTGTNFAQLFEQHLRVAPPSLATVNGSFPPDLVSLVNNLLEKTPEKRPFSARTVQGRLMQLIDQQLTDEDRQRDVSAAQVVDRTRLSLAERIRSRGREISWFAVAGIFAIAATVVVVAWAFGK